MIAAAEPDTFLALLPEDDRDALLARCALRRFARGERLMHQGERGDRVLVLRHGHAQISGQDAHGRDVVLGFRGPGDVLGELTFSHSGPRSSHVTAMEPVEAYALDAPAFRDYLLRRPAAALTLIDVLAMRFRDANLKMRQFADLDSVGRIAARLIELCDRYGTEADGGVRIELAITQDDLASWAACSRAGLTSGLRTMRELGWIETGRRRITVLDLQALARRAT